MLDVPATDQKSFADGKILKNITDGVGVVTFNSPEKRNAMSLEMWEGVGQALTELREDDHVRVVILTGAGDKAFMSGADISQFEKNRHNAQASEEYNRKSEAQRAVLAHFPKPTIACIRGFCLGGGMQVAMSADMRFASDNSQFGIPAAKLDIAYGYDGRKHLVFAGRTVSGPPPDVHGHADRLCRGLEDRARRSRHRGWKAVGRNASSRPHHLRQCAAVDQGQQVTIAQVLKDKDQRDMAAIKAISTACMDSEDFREGRQAFMEKRKPNFKGR